MRSKRLKLRLLKTRITISIILSLLLLSNMFIPYSFMQTNKASSIDVLNLGKWEIKNDKIYFNNKPFESKDKSHGNPVKNNNFFISYYDDLDSVVTVFFKHGKGRHGLFVNSSNLCVFGNQNGSSYFEISFPSKSVKQKIRITGHGSNFILDNGVRYSFDVVDVDSRPVFNLSKRVVEWSVFVPSRPVFDKHGFSYPLKLNGLKPVLVGNNSFVLFSGGDTFLTLGRPVIVDNIGQRFNGSYNLSDNVLSFVFDDSDIEKCVFPIVVDPDITFGSEYVFNSAITYYTSVSALDSSHFVVAYKDYGHSSYGTACIGTVSGSSISFGSEYVFNSGTTSYVSVSSLDSSHFVVAYQDYSHSSYGTACIGTVSGSSISFGSEYVFNSATTYYTSVSALDSSHFVVAYKDSFGYGTACIGTVSGSTISYGSEYVCNFGSVSYVSVSSLDSSHFVVAYQDTYNSYYGTACIGTVSGSSISFGSESVFNSVDTISVSVSALDSSHFVVAYKDYGNSDYGTACIGTVSGSSISFGSEYVFNSADTRHTFLSALDSSHFVVAYQDYGHSSYGTACIGTVSGSSISFGSEYVFNSADTRYTSVSALDSSHFVVAYQDYGHSSYGTACIGSLPDTTAPTPNPATWSSEPSADSISAISMTATTASDSTPPIYCQFDETTGHSGGTDSGWQQNDYTYTDNGLSENTLYTYRCQYKDSASTPNIGDWSSSKSVYTLVGAPTDAEFTIDSYSQTWINMSVAVPPNYNAGSTGCYFAGVTGTPPDSGWITGSTNYTGNRWYYNCTGLSPSTTYGFKVKFRNGDGTETSYTSEKTQTTSSANTPPTQSGESPTNSSTGINLQPTCHIQVNDSDGDTMTVYWYENSTGSWVLRQTNSSISNGTYYWTFTQASDYDTTYWWKVAVNDGTDNTTAIYHFTTREQYIPDPPSGFTATANGRFEIDLSWNDDVEADSTRVEYSLSDDATWNVGDYTLLYNGSAESTSHTGLDPGATVYYKAWSWNETDGVWSSGSTTSASTNSNNPPTISNPSPSNGSTNQPLSLTWSVVINDLDGDTFNWSIECSNGQESHANNETNGTKQLFITGLAYSTTYTVWVNATDGHNTTKTWYTFTAKHDTSIAINTSSDLLFFNSTSAIHYNINASGQTSNVCAINITNNGSIPVNITVKLNDSIGNNIHLKWNNTFNPPTYSSSNEENYEILRPNANGDTNDYSPYGSTSNYECVDEETPDGTTTHVSSSVTNNIDLYELPNVTSDKVINNVTVYITHYETFSPHGWAQSGVIIKTHSTEYKDPLPVSQATWTTDSKVYSTNPYTNSAWTIAEINDLQVGTYTHEDNDAHVYCTQVYVKINYCGTEYNCTNEINTTETTIKTNLGVGNSTCIYLWADFDNATNTATINRTINILSSAGTGYSADNTYKEINLSFVYSAPSNNPPSLSNPSASPTSGVADYTTFYFNVTYTDADGDQPTTIKVNISKTGWYSNVSMTWVSGDNTTGALYSYSTTLSAGTYSYMFYASDGEASTVNDSTGQITVEELNVTIDVEPNSYDWGFLDSNTVESTTNGYFTVTNIGNVNVDVTIRGTNASNGTGVKKWTLVESASPGFNEFSLQYSLNDGSNWYFFNWSDNPVKVIYTSLAPQSSINVDLKLIAPSGTDYYEEVYWDVYFGAVQTS